MFATWSLWGGVDLHTVQQWLWSLRHGEYDAIPEAIAESAGAREGE